MTSALIVYFSKHGNTKSGALKLSEKWHLDAVELKEIHKGNFVQAIFKGKSKLVGQPWRTAEKYDHIVLMGPIWASNGVPAINAFIDRMDWHHKSVTIITFQMFEDHKNSDQVHDYITKCIEEKGGLISSKYALIGGKMNTFAGDEAIENEIDKVELIF